MKGPTVFMLMALLLSPAPAMAQTRWAHPRGVFSLSLGVEWQELVGEAVQAGRPDPERIARFALAAPGVSVLHCEIRETRHPAPQGGTQASLNAFMMEHTPSSTEEYVVSEVVHGTVDGITVISFARRGSGYEAHSRVFAVLTPSEAFTIYEINCGAAMPWPATDLNAVRSLLATLRMGREPP